MRGAVVLVVCACSLLAVYAIPAVEKKDDSGLGDLEAEMAKIYRRANPTPPISSPSPGGKTPATAASDSPAKPPAAPAADKKEEQEKGKILDKPNKPCKNAIGIQTGDLDDDLITASSKQPKFSTTDPWCPIKNDKNQYLQIDLTEPTFITKISTQGRIGDIDNHVKSYAIYYSDDEKNWKTYKDTKGGTREFEANKNMFSVQDYELDPMIKCRYIRINPRSWENAICLRWELYGCSAVVGSDL